MAAATPAPAKPAAAAKAEAAPAKAKAQKANGDVGLLDTEKNYMILVTKEGKLLTIDFDPEKLPGDNHVWKTFKRNLSYIHLPSPALQLTPEFELLKWYR